jgi:hypothetical protein
LLLSKHYWEEQIKEDKMGGACGTFGVEEEYIEFWWGKVKKRDGLQDIGVHKIVIECMLKKEDLVM